MGAARAEQPVGDRRIRVERPDEPAEQRRQDAEADDRRADDADRIAPALGDPPLAWDSLPGRGCARGAHETLILGSRKPQMRATSRIAAWKTAAMISVAVWIAG